MSLPSFRVDGQVAVVTGSGSGIGRAIALGLSESGARLVITARSRDRVDAVAEEIHAAGGEALAVCADLTDPEGAEQLHKAVLDHYGRCDILVNNAGVNIRKTDSFKVTEEEIDRVLAVNLQAAMRCSLLFGRDLCETGNGKIVNIASIAGAMAVRTGLAYAASKAGMMQMTRYLALEWGSRGVRVNAIAPWYFNTPLTKPVLADEAYRAKVMARTMLPRLGEVEDLAALTVFLASDASGFITAQTIYCDGGMREYGFDPTV